MTYEKEVSAEGERGVEKRRGKGSGPRRRGGGG